MIGPTILHVDLDAFFASVEQVLHPELRGQPVIVGSAQKRRGVVVSASYEARPCGVHAGMPIYEARRLCPNATYLAGEYSEYRRFSREVFDLLTEVSPDVEKGSLDEAYLDLGGCRRLYGTWSAGPLGRLPYHEPARGVYLRREDSPPGPRERSAPEDHHRWVAAVAAWVQRTVRARTGLPISVGCATNKLAAKCASDFGKPRGLVLVEPGAEEAFFGLLSLEDIPGLGHAVRRRLRRWNVRTVEEARRLPGHLLRQAFGSRQGEGIFQALRGRGSDVLSEPDHPSSISRETTFWHASNDRWFVEAMLFYLIERVGNALRRQGLAGRRVHLKLRYHDFSGNDTSRTLDSPTSEDQKIFRTARRLLVRRWSRTRRLRLIGVKLTGLHPIDGYQQDLFDDTEGRHRRLDRCLDGLRDRYGFSVVQRGAAIELTTRLEKKRDGYRLRTPALSR